MRSKLCVNISAYLTRGWFGFVVGTSSSPFGPTICSRASTPISTQGVRTPLSPNCTLALRTTNHSRAFQDSTSASLMLMSKQLLMPTTGCEYSPMDSSLRYTSAWNMTSPTLVGASHRGSKRFVCHSASEWSSGDTGPALGSREKSGSEPSNLRTFNASARYSRFTAVVGSPVGAKCTFRSGPSNTRQHVPFGTGHFAANPEFRGIRAAFQPMPYCKRYFRFWAASFSRRDLSSSRADCSASCAAHSACRWSSCAV
mmetsp:Transcript_31022/g.84090  ORF Transcript_31022/g.84090 Transcript_31022/m.84090 type:complete len:256 (-) Transcript_31022:713-1480(-)